MRRDRDIEIERHLARVRRCRRCPDMSGPVVTGRAVRSPVLLVGQAPGAREGAAGRPFAWTAGRTLFCWFAGIGLDEERFRATVYMAAVCRCYPGRNGGGGDRVPSAVEIGNCSGWLQRELELLRPELVIPVGRLAIAQFIAPRRLVDVVGRRFDIRVAGEQATAVPLPHPSGASPWHRTEPGLSLLHRALGIIAAHPAWRRIAAPSAS